jgi:hypothetical protein
VAVVKIERTATVTLNDEEYDLVVRGLQYAMNHGLKNAMASGAVDAFLSLLSDLDLDDDR